MDVQKEVEKILLSWDNLKEEEITEKIMTKISEFKKQKNVKIFLKLLIENLHKKTNQMILDMKDLPFYEKRKHIQKLRIEMEKIDVIKTIYEEFKKNYVEEKKEEIVPKVKVNIETYKTSVESIMNSYNEIEMCMRKNEDIDEYDLPSSVDAFSYFIRNSNVIMDKELIIKYSDYLCNSLVEYLYDNNNIFVEFCYLLDSLKNKINEYERDTLERKLLKDIQKRFKNIYKIYSNNNELKNNKDQYFEIIDYYLDKENYFSIQELIKRKPEICNLSNEDGHVSLHILNKYIENFKKMTKDKNSNYINVKYLKEIYELFTTSPSLRIKYEDRQKIDSTINEFCIYIKSTLIKRRRKNFAIREAKSMKSSNFYNSKMQYELREFRDDNITYEKQRIINQLEDYMSVRENIPTEDAFVIGNNAYTLKEEEGNIYLKMHSLNISSFIKRKSLMDSYFEQCKYKGEDVDDFVLRGFKYKQNKKYPVISYTLEFFQSGKLKNLTIDKNFINITDVYNTMYNKDEIQTEFYELYKKSVSKNGGTLTTFDTYQINDHFEDMLTIVYTNFIKDHKLPFMYYGYRKQTEKELKENKTFLATKLNGLDKASLVEMLHILTSRIDKFHYSQFPIENPVYDLKIIDSLNYLGLENQRMLKDLYFNDTKLENPERIMNLKKEYYRYYDKKVDELNSSINYVDMTKVDKYRGRMIVKKIFY